MGVIQLKFDIKKIKLFNNLSDIDINNIIKHSTIKKYKKTDLVFAEKEKLQYFYFILEGIASLYKPNKDDNGKKVLFLLGEGELLNELILDDEPSILSCELLTEGTLLILNKNIFIDLLKTNFNLCKSLINLMITREKRMIHQIKTNSSTMTVDRQLAFKLWKLGKDFGKTTIDGIEINFDLSITYLAEILGNKRETISRQMKLLVNNSFISVYRKRVTIKNPEGLLNYFRYGLKN